MLLSLWSDELYSYDGQTIHRIWRDIDKQLPAHLYAFSQNTTTDKELYVLNGPGSFTNTRIGCLAVNTLMMLHPTISIYQSNKLELYTQLYTTGTIPRYCILRIGQRRKFRCYDRSTTTYDEIFLDSINDLSSHLEEKKISDDAWMIDTLVTGTHLFTWLETRIISPETVYQHRELFTRVTKPLEPYYGVVLHFDQAK